MLSKFKAWLKGRRDCAREYEIANRIVRCFDGARLDRQTFRLLGADVIKDSHGETAFYPATDIDKIMSNINELIDELKRGRPLKRNLTPEQFKEQSK